ncbi:MAG: MarR family transcriptional regulator [Spirochaetes bacterium]|nr:MAG: MarR family transcriptional regulator [Spirochaetota bacterium]
MKVKPTNFLYTLSRIRQKAYAFLEEEMAHEGLEGVAPSYGDVLYIVERKGPMPMKEISRYTYKDKSTITGIVQRLTEHGYFTRVQDPSDGRVSLIAVTDKMKAARPAVGRVSGNLHKKLYAALSDGERETLFALLEKMNDSL